MSREPGPDDGRDEAYEDGGLTAAARSSGGIILTHRYSIPDERPSEAELDQQAARNAVQDLNDSGRAIFGMPWLREHGRALKVKHRQWKREVNGQGWTHKRCGFPARTAEIQILHQQEHEHRDRIDDLLAADYEAQLVVNADLREQITALADELAYQVMRFDVLAITVGHADPDALQATVERIMGYARDVAKRRETGRENAD